MLPVRVPHRGLVKHRSQPYKVTAFRFFLFAGLPALALRAEPARQGPQFMNEHT
ncbi:hypothetical protein [Streptomyces sp. MBT33]|uniref:hypothetical protein n=1 Tax=Streptomyces sp. MBT33 TaxID=1488363 RepID=UPI0019097248|nr:hypothetical protein [Streptomyces sp. MBT33]MBK3645887.1 hypothetical protein [Streptomyces sp. MBT33]